VLLKAGIELPDAAREVVFPNGVPIRMEGAGEPAALPEEGAGTPPVDEEASDATLGEGDLTNESNEVRRKFEGKAPEADVNLLKA
jgi:small conductance mechanosensitive channel